MCRLKRRVEFSRIFKKIKIGVVRKSRGRKTLHVYLDTYIYTHTHSIAARSIFATMIPPRSRIARFNGTEIFRLAILGSKQRRSSVKGRQSYKISSMFRCIPPVLKCVRLFRVKRGEKDAPMIRAIDYSVNSCSRETGKMEKEEEKIQNRTTEFCTRSPRFNDFLSLSLFSKFFSVRRPRKISYSPRRRK